MNPARLRVLASALLAALVCASCAFWGSTKIQLKDLEIVQRTDQPIPMAPGQWGTLPGRLVRVTFELDKNLRAFKANKGLNISFDAWFCPDKQRELSYLSFVYDDAGVLEMHQDEKVSSNNEVRVYLAEIAAATTNFEGKPIPAYDLKTSTDDVCVRVRAISMALQGTRTAVVRIPAADLAAKLGSSGVPFR